MKWSGESPSTAVVIAVPEYGNGRSSHRGRSCSRAQEWSGQSPSTKVVWAVPEHKKWSGQCPSTVVVRANPRSRALLVLLFGVFIFLYFSAKSSLTRLVKKANRYSTSFCLLIFSGKQSVDTCIEVCQCGPSYTINEEARTLLTKERVY